jgi:hypothetical protein
MACLPQLVKYSIIAVFRSRKSLRDNNSDRPRLQNNRDLYLPAFRYCNKGCSTPHWQDLAMVS